MTELSAKHKIERLWQNVIQAKPLSLSGVLRTFVLWPLSLFYRLGFAISGVLAPRPLQIQIPLIIVGGVTVGGAGKTPFVALLVRELQARGKKVGVVLSGYGRSSKQKLIVDGATLLSRPAAETGDEPRELAELFPSACFAIGDSKREIVKALADKGAVDVIVVDDGFQTRGLKADLSIALINSQSRAADFRLLPAGRLRESLSALNRADIVVFSKLASLTSQPEEQIREAVGSVFNGLTFNSSVTLQVARVSPSLSAGSRCSSDFEKLIDPALLVSGLADNSDFLRGAERLGIQHLGVIEFPDHFQYDTKSVAEITARAQAAGASAIVASAKDWVKLREFSWNVPVWTITVRAEVNEPRRFSAVVAESLQCCAAKTN